MKSHHNRWHPSIEPTVTVAPGDAISVPVPDGAAGQVTRAAIDSGLRDIDLEKVHPLVGPVFVDGARPGDVLEVQIRAIRTSGFGWTGIFPMPGGLLSDMVDEPVLVPWSLSEGGARTELLPGIKVARNPNVGVVGVAPSLELLGAISERETRLSMLGEWMHLPSSAGALPAGGPAATEGLRTLAARETGGNLDIRGLGEGSTVLLPVHVDGGLFSLGDVHFSQGDGECFGTGIETSAEIELSFGLRRQPRWRLDGPALISATGQGLPAQGLIVTTGMSLDAYQDVGGAVRDAVTAMIGCLTQEHGLSVLGAQILISVAASINVSVVNNPPCPVVAVGLPLELFAEP